jgi:phage terminase small subunit
MEILATVVYGRLRDEGLTTPAGEPRKLLAEYRAIRSAQLAIARELGLTPAARRTLASTGKTFDLAAEFAALNAKEAEPTPTRQPGAEDAPETPCAR